ncbi:excisionase family DNA binding protein [Herbaspirillum sp. Sphag1AN]|uniref:response regulator n=1 Tax=unclassified Herbaspirillum TaxID=2624150 RepID=UPI0016209C59|nr:MULTISPECIES: response regulator [unclassified Herbaspirillum]MBB3214263.1 excisionase family DNA binding protein [Herbaspirillum sp. Sphag1AN]MBB3247315.1 excisionase family DNA binding protein [Herbaspirillum sp. Sphag64]
MTTTEVCTTQEAAQILGISVTSVQQLVEAGVIEAWKTKGGHRRIPMAAVQAYKSAPNGGHEHHEKAPISKQTAILVVEDNKLQRDIYAKKIASWNLPATTTFCENGYQALVEIASKKPDIVLADIVMDGIDGYEVISTILSYPSLADINIAILSSLSEEELQSRGGIPEGVVFFRKPVNYDELSGYLRACCAQKVRLARS